MNEYWQTLWGTIDDLVKVQEMVLLSPKVNYVLKEENGEIVVKKVCYEKIDTVIDELTNIIEEVMDVIQGELS